MDYKGINFISHALYGDHKMVLWSLYGKGKLGLIIAG